MEADWEFDAPYPPESPIKVQNADLLVSLILFKVISKQKKELDLFNIINQNILTNGVYDFFVDNRLTSILTPSLIKQCCNFISNQHYIQQLVSNIITNVFYNTIGYCR